MMKPMGFRLEMGVMTLTTGFEEDNTRIFQNFASVVKFIVVDNVAAEAQK